VLVLASTLMAAGLVVPATVAGAYATAQVEIFGHGFGHGIGMGQWGALGYALGQDAGQGTWRSSQIVDHFYAPATLAVDGNDSETVKIALTENNGNDVIATAPGGVTVPGAGGVAPAVLFAPTGSTWAVYASGSCAGGASGWGSPVALGMVDPTTSAANGGEIQLCLVGGNHTYHGSLTGVYNSLSEARTVNTLPVGVYVADVVPSESPVSWGELGGPGPDSEPWGFQELEAQAIAARSYVLSTPDGYGGYADTCDQTCQSYPGTFYENQLSNYAVIDTVGQVMKFPGAALPAVTEYSASTGGYTASSAAPEYSPFNPVPDDGDAICLPGGFTCNLNLNHDWQVSVAVSTIQAAWPQIGTLLALRVLSRNGYGDYGGRVSQISVVGTAGTVTMYGTQFAGALGLKSDWFIIGGAPSGGVGGYLVAGNDGSVFAFGDAGFEGSMGGHPLNEPVVGMAATPDGKGYWLAASDGGIFTFGDAGFDGSMGGHPLNEPVVGMAATPDGRGYWEVASDGGVFTFGDAPFLGSMGGHPLNEPVVGMAATPDGRGYWEVASDGGVFTFGDAGFYGSMGGHPLNEPVVGMAATPDGRGYWEVASDGGIFTFGDAGFYGSGASSSAGEGTTAIVHTATGHGYLIVTGSGAVLPFGDAPVLGDLTTSGTGYAGRVVGVATTS
jgi:peptidoglycan hydrolase-like amidase